MQKPGKEFVQLLLLALVTGLVALYAFRGHPEITTITTPKDSLPAAAASPEQATTSIAEATTSAPSVPKRGVATSSAIVKKASPRAIKSTLPASPSGNTVTRIEHPYTAASLPSSLVNERARGALVNILCMTHSGAVRPISGSGVIIDPRGVILTNAHVAQYVLLSESARLDFQCYIRSGSPAMTRWIARVMYIPSIWVSSHASEITSTHVTSTGEHDYALLSIVASADGSSLPSAFPYLPVETREGVSFIDDGAVVVSYPAEFLGGLAATSDLYSAGSVTTIRQLLTFGTKSIDAISLGGVIEAQSGSSGGAAVNAWGYLIGVITTTSEGTTTADRDLRAITLSYINRDLQSQTGYELSTILGGDIALETSDFTEHTAPQLIDTLLKQVFNQ